MLESLRRDYTELTEYLNKLEAGYNQSLEYIGHLEEIIALVVFFVSSNGSVHSVGKEEMPF